MNIALLKKPRQAFGARRVRDSIAAKRAAAQAELERATDAYVQVGAREAMAETGGAKATRRTSADYAMARAARDAAADRLALMEGALAEAERRVAEAERADADTALLEAWEEAGKLAQLRDAAFDKVERLLGDLEAASRDLVTATKELASKSPRIMALPLAERREQLVTQAHRMHRFLDLFTRAFRREDEFEATFDVAAAKVGIREVERDWSRLAGTRDAAPRQFACAAF